MAAGLEITREDQSIVERKIELLDVPEQDIEQGIGLQDTGGNKIEIFTALTDCNAFLADCERSGSNVLVHCNAGVRIPRHYSERLASSGISRDRTLLITMTQKDLLFSLGSLS